MAAGFRLVTAVLATLTVWGVFCARPSDHKALRRHLLTNYTPEVRPIINDTQATKVFLSLDLLSIVEIKEKDQALVTNGRLLVEWEDDLMVWEPSTYSGIYSLLLTQESIWKPDIVLSNPVSDQGLLGHDGLLVTVGYQGKVRWAPMGVFETSCTLDITYYPMDTQKCAIVFRTEMSGGQDVALYVRKLRLDYYTANGQWEIVDTAADDIIVNGVRIIQFQLELRRRRFFYVLNVILPVVFLSLTSSLVFALPADAGEKMGLSITVLLAYAVYLTLITDAMPNTSMQVSLVAVYLMMLLGLCAVNVVLTVFILRLHHRSESNPINRRFGRIILKLRRLLRFRDQESQAAGLDTVSEDLKPESKRTERHRPPHLITNAFETTNRHGSVELGKYNGKSVTRKRSIARGRSVHSLNNTTEAERCADNNEAVSGKVVAETLDFLLFVVCTVLSLGTTFLCLLTLVAGSATNALDTTLN